jgi:hypothetical protein
MRKIQIFSEPIVALQNEAQPPRQLAERQSVLNCNNDTPGCSQCRSARSQAKGQQLPHLVPGRSRDKLALFNATQSCALACLPPSHPILSS